jgi:polyribonucleotide nucleotidyltransferase
MLKDERKNKMKEIIDTAVAQLNEKFPEKEKVIKQIILEIEKEEMRRMIIEEGRRLDGRGLRDVRPITCEVGLLPRTHGSALFTRGETQSLATLTLGTKMDQQLIDGLLPEYSKRYMFHYNFPPFATGEVGRPSNPSRREIGHGNLAERALEFVLPDEKDFPYTIRIVSDVLESNGSSSMASVCAGTLAMLDGGVPIKKSVAGIAMGLIKEADKIAVLTDILGNEDHLGDMDFKVAGTKDGITAFQMDIKIKGISYDILAEALQEARVGRLKILDIMDNSIQAPRNDISQFAPRLTTMKIKVDQIGLVIGPGGKTIRNIVQESGAEINIEEDGTVVIAAVTRESSEKAMQMINRLVELPEEGKIYKGIIKKIVDFGAFVEILPGKEGLLHISQIAHSRINKVEDVLKVGQEIEVKLLKVEDENRFSLSRKVLLKSEVHDKNPKNEGKQPG